MFFYTIIINNELLAKDFQEGAYLTFVLLP